MQALAYTETTAPSDMIEILNTVKRGKLRVYIGKYAQPFAIKMS
jgi:hypothetical protein